MAVMSVDPAVHAHEWSLLGVSFEDSGVLEKYECTSCGDVTYRCPR